MAQGVRLTGDQEQEIVAMYLSGLTCAEISDRGGWASSTIARVLQRHSVQVRTGGKSRLIPDADVPSLIAAYESGATCDDLARDYGGVSRETVAKAIRRGGGRLRTRFKGHRFTTPDGYVKIKLADDDPLAASMHRRSYSFEHRVVMARHLGRPLAAHETVHHINGVRNDNRIENLQLRSGKHGSGHALGCMDCGSHKIGPTRIADRPLEWIDWTLIGEAA